MLPSRSLKSAAIVPFWMLAGLAVGPVTLAQDASGWDAEPHTAVRLIAGSLTKSDNATFVRAGIEIKLDPGWHTYWRDPGDSGAPPVLDFSGSDNVKTVKVLWPAPQRFPDGAGGNSIGYLDHLLLPLHVVPADPTKPSSLALKLSYDICGSMCVPVEVNLGLKLAGDGAEETVLEKAEVHVPRHVALGAPSGDKSGGGLAVVGVHREPGGAHDRVVVDVAAPAGVPVDLFAEGPTPEWSLPLPEPTGGDKGTLRHFAFDLDGLPPDAQAKGATLTFTAVDPNDAIEVPARLD